MKRTRREVLLVGETPSAHGIERALERIDVVVRRIGHVEDVGSEATAATVAVVLVTERPDPDVTAAMDRLAKMRQRTGARLFVVVPDEYPDERALRLYEAGADVVFEWPYEAVLMPTVVSGLIGAPPRRGDEAGDAALTRAVRARLRLSDVIGDDVMANVVDGAASLSGRVDSYWKKERVEGMLTHVPGVTAVFSDALEIVPPQRDDAELARDVRNVLRSVAGIDAKTISCSVDRGRVVLAGSVSTHYDLDRLLNIVGSVEGVRAIENLVTVSAPDTRRAQGLAARLREGIAELWPRAEVEVTVFGGVAVLRGHTRLLADKREIVGFARETTGIERVVDKLSVVAA